MQGSDFLFASQPGCPGWGLLSKALFARSLKQDISPASPDFNVYLNLTVLSRPPTNTHSHIHLYSSQRKKNQVPRVPTALFPVSVLFLLPTAPQDGGVQISTSSLFLFLAFPCHILPPFPGAMATKDFGEEKFKCTVVTF
jgi:hypothetical protein